MVLLSHIRSEVGKVVEEGAEVEVVVEAAEAGVEEVLGLELESALARVPEVGRA